MEDFVKKSFLYFKKKVSLKVVFVVALFLVSWGFYFVFHGPAPKTAAQTKESALSELSSIPADAQLSLITEPDDDLGKIDDVINNASKSLDVVMYEFEDPRIEQEIVDAKNRGVNVKVILQNLNTFGAHPNQDAYDFFNNNHVSVKWAPTYFALTHQKTIIADGNVGVIMTFNFSPRYYDSGRDFAVVDQDQDDITAMSDAFMSDWNGSQNVADNARDLVWSPGSADTMVALINSAKTSLDIYNEEMADARVIDALKSAAGRGVLVRVDMTYQTTWKDAFNELIGSGVQIKTYAATAKTYIHAKAIVADNDKVFLGSENFSFQSLDSNRELGILISKPDIVSAVEKTFNADWAGARVFGNSTADTGIVKLSKSGLCHTPSSPSYNQTKTFTPFNTLAECLAAGGKLSSQ